MKLGVNLDYFTKNGRTVEYVLPLLKKYGFTSFDHMIDAKADDWQRRAEDFRALADSVGVGVHQSHATFFRYDKTVTSTAQILPTILRTVKAAAILGARQLVIHADEYHPAPGEVWSTQKVGDVMYDYLAPVVEEGKKQGVGIAIENLFEEAGRDAPRSRYCSAVEELQYLLDRFNDPALSVCWDFGHGRCSFGDNTAEAMRSLAKHITCTHVHDNVYFDDHEVPCTGKMDWQAHMDVLKQAGYDGYLTYELVYGHIPDPALEPYLAFIRSIGEYLLSL